MPYGATMRIKSTSFRNSRATSAKRSRSRSRGSGGRKIVATPSNTATTTSWVTFPSAKAAKRFMGMRSRRISATDGAPPRSVGPCPARVIPTPGRHTMMATIPSPTANAVEAK
jgi:hypothetical protein